MDITKAGLLITAAVTTGVAAATTVSWLWRQQQQQQQHHHHHHQQQQQQEEEEAQQPSKLHSQPRLPQIVDEKTSNSTSRTEQIEYYDESKDRKPLVIGHRGFGTNRGELVENTIISFTKAIQYPLDGLETDVRITTDGHFVLAHDAELNHKRIDNMTLEEVLREHVGYGQGLCTLKELMDLIPEPVLMSNGKRKRFQLILELKDDKFKQYEYVHMLFRFLQETNTLHKVAKMSCFNHIALSHASKCLNEVQTAYVELCPLFNRENAPFPEDFLNSFDFQPAEIHGNAVRLTRDISDAIHQRGYRTLVCCLEWEWRMEGNGWIAVGSYNESLTLVFSSSLLSLNLFRLQ